MTRKEALTDLLAKVDERAAMEADKIAQLIRALIAECEQEEAA